MLFLRVDILGSSLINDVSAAHRFLSFVCVCEVSPSLESRFYQMTAQNSPSPC